ncbi:nicotinate-nucleotide adenylyltransferase [Metamycoplasma hominis]|uniref:nicotinate-nucleotide adenylyltransferase n=1 Tax=Metamycoplasma hominis TaxID=2098 RepID=UPI0012AAEB6B|nr:nicotinate-nucleotide adenylyltransferase [Metamycoplasma hominis]
MKIGIFGGSFDPVHKGHILIANDAIELLKLDKVIFVPANKNPFKDKQDYASNEHRINMINIVINKSNMEVSQFETKRGGTSYTIDTVKYFAQKYPKDELYFLIGSDNVGSLNKWKDIEEISRIVKIVVFNRNNIYSKINIKKYNCLVLKNSFHPFSSTSYKNGNINVVDERVQEYIGKNCLYLENIAKNTLSIPRFKHLRYTAEFSAQLAKRNNFDVELAYRTGFMHDITKEWDINKAYKFLSSYGYNEQNLPEYMLHQTTAYYWLRDVYKYQNDEALQAIKIHTSLDFKISLLAKILYIADKICEGRKWPGIQKIRELALNNLEEGFKEVIRICGLKFNEQKGIIFDEKQKEIYKLLLK